MLHFFAAVTALILVVPGGAVGKTIGEYQLKAVFLYRLALFVTWPDALFTDPAQPFVIGILGDDPFGSHIDRAVSNEKVGSRPIRLRRYASIDEVLEGSCQILFVSRELRQPWPRLKRRLGDRSLLTVSDMERFGQMGGMVHIRTRFNRIKLGINVDETRKAGLWVSSKLLKVARQVKSDSQGGGQ